MLPVSGGELVEAHDQCAGHRHPGVHPVPRPLRDLREEREDSDRATPGVRPCPRGEEHGHLRGQTDQVSPDEARAGVRSQIQLSKILFLLLSSI